MLEVRQLTKHYGAIQAVHDLTFSVARGEIVGFLGPNGAGKTTTLRIIAGFIGADSGTVKIDGVDVQLRPVEARARLGYMPEAAPLYPELRVHEYLDFRAALKRVTRAERKAAVERAMRRAAVADVAERLIGQLSKGYRQRVALADALVAQPSLLVLDEPTAGLDPNQIRQVRDLIRELAAQHTILLSTHILSEVESLCHRALVIHHGRLVAQGTLAELGAQRHSNCIVVTVRDPNGSAAAVARGCEGVERVDDMAASAGIGRWRITHRFERDADTLELCERLGSRLSEGGLRVLELYREAASLEQVFSQLTEESGRQQVAEGEA